VYRCQALPYFCDSALLFESLADLPWALFLDSGRPHGALGRFDILSAEPFATLVTRDGVTTISEASGERESAQSPFQLLRQMLSPWQQSPDELPFYGGAIGYFGYDLARLLESLPELSPEREPLPQMAVGIYDWALVVDHKLEQSWLVSAGRDPKTAQIWPQLLARFQQLPVVSERRAFQVESDLSVLETQSSYRQALSRIHDYIQAGDCYQVNFAQRFEARVSGDSWLAYQSLRQVNPAPYGAYFKSPFATLLSSSPECFLQHKKGHVVTQPIKGTRPRLKDSVADQALADELLNSSKDRAENLMIVDLLRNDLSKQARLGSVKVAKLFELQSFARVHHLVSQVEAELEQGADVLQLFEDCFPGGSITGAPKIRAMQIIEELEVCRRGIYCGSIAYIGFDAMMDSNIAIRTMVRVKERIHFWAGGGIVADSQWRSEYQESLDKAAAFIDFLTQNKHQKEINNP